MSKLVGLDHLCGSTCRSTKDEQHSENPVESRALCALRLSATRHRALRSAARRPPGRPPGRPLGSLAVLLFGRRCFTDAFIQAVRERAAVCSAAPTTENTPLSVEAEYLACGAIRRGILGLPGAFSCRGRRTTE